MFWGTPDSGSTDSLNLLPALGTLSFLLGCVAEPWREGLCLVLLYPGLPCLVDIHGRPALFWGETGREVDLEERGAWENWEEWKEGKLQRECVVEAINEWCHAWWVGLPTSTDMIKTISTVGPRGQPPSFWVILESVKLTKDTRGHVQQDRKQR